MVRRPLVPVLVGLVVALAPVSAAPASGQAATADSAQPQTIAFTSTPPEGADWFSEDYGFGISYVASATATSGLPVIYSVTAESAEVCSIAHDFDGSFAPNAAVRFRGPGTCTILADQPGNEEYLPAEQASQSFVIEKVQPSLSGLKGTRGLLSLVPATFRAVLEVPINLDSRTHGWGGYPDQVVTFSVAGKPVCSGTTDAHGIATCSAPLRLAAWLQLTFTASYAGDDRYKPVTANGLFLG
jgi:hypothetical protein